MKWNVAADVRLINWDERWGWLEDLLRLKKFFRLEIFQKKLKIEKFLKKGIKMDSRGGMTSKILVNAIFWIFKASFSG